MRFTIILSIVLFAVSACTIEKRVHNRGWHVQWKKHHKVSKDKVKDDVTTRERNTQELFSSEENLSIEVQEEMRHEETVRSVVENESTDHLEIEIEETISEPKSIDATENLNKTVHPDMKKEKQIFTERKTKRRSENNPLPIALMVLGILAIVMAVVLFLSIASMSELGAILVTIIGVGVLVILGLILLLVGFTVLARSN